MNINRILRYILLIFLGFFLQTCQKIEKAEHQFQSKTFSLSLLVQPVSEPTKAAYMGFDFGWEAGDMAAIIAPNNLYTPLMLDSLFAGKKLGSFKGTLNNWDGEQDIYVIYPWSQDGKNRVIQSSATFQFDLREIQTFDCSNQTLFARDNARYSLMLGKTRQTATSLISVELNQMMSFLDFSATNAGTNKVLEIQFESADSVFTKSSVFSLIDQSNTVKHKTKKLTIAAVNNSPGDLRLPLTIFPVNLSPGGLNKPVFANVIVQDGTTKELKLYRFNKGVPSKPYEKNTRYQATLDLNTVTPIAYDDELYLDLTEKAVDYIAGSFQVYVHSNSRKWSVGGMPDWVTLSKTSGETSEMVTVNVKTNTHFLPRTVTITFTAGTEKRTLTINQALNKEVASDKAVLEAFFAAAGGVNWTSRINWLSDKPLGEWKYIKTDKETGRVNSIVIEMENLRGSLSEEIYKLSELKELLIFIMEPGSFKIIFSDKIKNFQKLETLHCHMSDDIPNEIFDLTHLKMLGVHGTNSFINRKFIGIPRFENLKLLERLIVYDFELGTQFPAGILTLKNLQRLQLGLETQTDQTDNLISVPEQLFDLTLLKELTLYFGYKLNFTPKIGNLLNLGRLAVTHPTGELTKDFFNLNKLYDVYLGNTLSYSDLSGTLSRDFGNMKSLYYFSIVNCNITGNLPKEIGNLPLLEQFRCDGNRLSGRIPIEVSSHPNWDKWSPNRWVIPQQDGYKLEVEKYVSTDFSEDGKIVKLHSATKGKGIDIVVLGDGFVDKEIGTGKIYDVAIEKFKNSFLELEPFKTYKDYFNIYGIKVVSKEKGVSSVGNLVETKFGTMMSQNSSPTFQLEKVQRYVDSLGLNNSHISLIANTYSLGGYTSYTHDSNTGKVKTVAQLDLYLDTYVISHESGGHGFGLLADEYMKVGYGETIPDLKVESTKQFQDKYGIYPNVDFTSDLTKIRWAHMVNHPKYQGTVGAYEGGLYFYKGVWRAEYQSIMGYLVGLNYFNAPSREAIVKQIKNQAGESYSFEDFVANDKIVFPPGFKSASITGKDRKHYPPRVIIDGKEMKN